jgi:hypothetical protein
MNPVMWLAVLIIGILLFWDWLAKKRRLARRKSMKNEEFLLAYRGGEQTPNDVQILSIRDRIAREFGLPPSKIRPEDELNRLRDYYSLVVSGHIAHGDLLDDLEADRRESSPESSLVTAETVREFIAASLAHL